MCKVFELDSCFSDSFLVELEQSMRNCILKLNASQTYINDLPDKSAFSIRLQTTFYSNFEFNHDPNYEVSAWLSNLINLDVCIFIYFLDISLD